MVSVIAWKEWRQQVAFVIAIVAFAGILLAITANYMPNEWERRSQDWAAGAHWVILLVGLAITQGVVTGAMLFAGESEDGTQDFLDQHAALRSPVWRAKILSGASLAGCSALALGGLLVALELKAPLGLPACVWFALDALAWSAACSVRRKTTFGAIGIGLIVLVVVSGLPLGLAVSKEGAIDYGVYFALKIPLLLAALAVSWWLYCSADFRRIRDIARPMSLRHPWRLPTWLTVALWHLWSRRKGTLALLIAAPLAIAYITRGSTPLLAWPIGTFLLGCIAGWAAFADEQAAGAERFLGDQRFPRWQLWVGKTLPLLTLGLLGGCLAQALSFVSTSNNPPNAYRFLPYWAYASDNVLLFSPYALSFAVLGFAIAQFATQQTRKMPVAIFLSLSLGATVAALWYPSLYAGLSAWRVWLLAAGFWVATLWLLPRWTSGRLHDRGGILRLVALVAVAALWLIGNLRWRAAQYADPGEPFDTKTYWTSLTETPDTHGAELRDAGLELKKRLEEANDQFSRLKPVQHVFQPDGKNPVAIVLDETPNWKTYRDEILRDGLPLTRGQWSEHLDFVFAGAWADSFKKAAFKAPDRLLSIGEMMSERLELSSVSYVFEGIDFFLIRFLVRARAGQTVAALDDLEVALAAIRHGLHRGGKRYTRSFLGANRNALYLADSTFDLVASDAAFRNRFIEILGRHDEAWPDFTDTVKTNYFAKVDLQPYHLPGSAENGEVHRVLINAPWERDRLQSLRNRTYATLLADAEAKRFPQRMAQPKDFEDFFGQPPFLGRDQYLWNQSHLYYSFGMEFISLLSDRFDFAYNLANVRGLRLVLAVTAYEADQGRPIASLEDLVPRYFKRLPEDPFLGRFFVARISDPPEAVWVHRGASLRIPQSVPSHVVILESNGETFAVPMAIKK